MCFSTSSCFVQVIYITKSHTRRYLIYFHCAILLQNKILVFFPVHFQRANLAARVPTSIPIANLDWPAQSWAVHSHTQRNSASIIRSALSLHVLICIQNLKHSLQKHHLQRRSVKGQNSLGAGEIENDSFVFFFLIIINGLFIKILWKLLK